MHKLRFFYEYMESNLFLAKFLFNVKTEFLKAYVYEINLSI
jgi:hypothetical protein